jgi:hypothetical protein
MYKLYIANKNYSSWSLRPWVLMCEAGIEFKEHLIPFGGPAWKEFLEISPSGIPASGHGKPKRAPGPAAPRRRCTRASRSCATAAP